MTSTSSSCKCPKSNHITQKYHGTYTRKVQDLPILGKSVQLEICSHEYACSVSYTHLDVYKRQPHKKSTSPLASSKSQY